MAAPPSPPASDFWVPLESNPAALTKFAHRLGVNPKWVFSDCLGLDDELLAMSPQPVIALVFLFPYSKMIQFREEEREKLEKAPQNISPKVYYMKQLVGNACGTVAMVHCIANNKDRLGVDNNSFFSKFLEKTRQVNPEERGKLFGTEDKLAEISESCAKDESTQTEAPAADANVDSHFVCFTEVDGHLYVPRSGRLSRLRPVSYELDGAKDFPVNHGPTSPEKLLFVRDIPPPPRIFASSCSSRSGCRACGESELCGAPQGRPVLLADDARPRGRSLRDRERTPPSCTLTTLYSFSACIPFAAVCGSRFTRSESYGRCAAMSARFFPMASR